MNAPNKPDTSSAIDIAAKFHKLGQILAGQMKLLIVLHNHPDPDALASGFALRYLTEKCFHVRATIAYDGLIGRAENQAMVRELKIPLKHIQRLRITNYQRIALLDTQPGAGNNALPSGVKSHVVLDHHPKRRDSNVSFSIIDPDIGATATILAELLAVSGLPIPVDVATAITYAIRSETQEFGRETSTRDLNAYFLVYPQASMRKLGKISHPKLSRAYFLMLSETLRRTLTFRHLICSHLGNVPMPEIVAEMADMLLRHERISWSLCTGRYDEYLLLSLRSSNPKAKAGQIMKHLVPDPKESGGHDMLAGGRIFIGDLNDDTVTILEITLSQQFAELMGFPNADWTPLLEDSI